MNKNEKIKAFTELYGLVNYFYENRDRPVNSDFDFYDEVKKYCEELDLDFAEFKKEFKLI